MNTAALFLPAVISLSSLSLILVGCRSQGPTKQSGVIACIGDVQSASYSGTGPNGPNSRTEVLVSGACFKTNPSRSDCQTRQPDHPVPSQREWRKCTKMLSSDALTYHVKVYHSAAYDLVEIRVRGQDGAWSNMKQIQK